MNIVSPFGRLSRKGYLSVAIPLFLVIEALDWVTWEFVPDAPASMFGTPWFRWLIIADPVRFALFWCLFCAGVKRLHDFRWSGLLALPVLWPWLQAALAIAFPLAEKDRAESWDLIDLFNAIELVGFGLQLYSLALLIMLAIVPGAKPKASVPAPEVF